MADDLADRLLAAARTRDLRALAPIGTANGDGANAFLRALAAEMHAFRAIALDAMQSVERNSAQLHAVGASTIAQRIALEDTATAIGAIERGAASVASSADTLGASAELVRRSIERYENGIGDVDAKLRELASEIVATGGLVTSMRDGDASIASFLITLARIARQARVLGINATIEAAFLHGVGGGFAIVATEVKALAESTLDSTKEVTTIQARLHAASDQTATAIDGAASVTETLTRDLDQARTFVHGTNAQVARLDRAIGDVAGIAARQSASLAAIVETLARVAPGARSIADGAARASALDLAGLSAALHELLDRYTLDDDAKNAPEIGVDTLDSRLHSAAQALRARVDADEREILATIVRIAVASARNGYEWRAIASGLDGVRADLSSATAALEDAARDARDAIGGASALRSALDAIGGGFASALRELGATLDRVADVGSTVELAERFATEAAAAGAHVGDILSLVDTITADTTLLAINAAIEAAHAGEAGGGFGVIADEIKQLADATAGAVHDIGATLDGVVTASRAISAATRDAVAKTTLTHASAHGMHATIDALQTELRETLARAVEVATVVNDQQATLTHACELARTALAQVDADSAVATDERRLELATLGTRAHALAARRPLGTDAERLRAFVFSAAAEIDAAFAAAIASGTLRIDDCFTDDYQPITGGAIASLGRLFDVSRVPATGFDPPKYATRFDRAVETDANAAIDRYVPQEALVTALVAVDLNGFCFAHYKACRADWTGDYETDLATNRIKRFFEDTLSLRCARVGMPETVVALPRRASRSEFRRAGARFERPAERPWGIFTFARDTGSVFNDLSVALYANDTRVGSLRCLYSADTL